MIAIEILFGFYFLFILLLIVGWRKMQRAGLPDSPARISVSILTPFRNEAENLPLLLSSLQKLKYPSDKLEVILIDDHSTDSSRDVINNFLERNSYLNFRIIESTRQGKKHALNSAIASARGEVILTTDADCLMGDKWVSAMSAPFVQQSVNMVVGSVRIESNNTFWSSMQQLEFSSLVGTSGATLSFHVPSMCNGANLAFRKSTFLLVGGYESNIDIASGDDEFLMRKFARISKQSIIFNSDSSSIVSTHALKSVSQFIQQRIRWAGKWKYSKNLFNRMLAIGIFAFHSSVIALYLLSVLNPTELLIPVSLLTGKLFTELAFLFSVSRWLRTNWSWPSFLIWQFAYPFYALYIGTLSLFSGYKWKDREYPAFAES
jgi:cellulose synthase/poly-beta-1,6-N-acetylglucosamine synthase-like glycosyltransferase